MFFVCVQLSYDIYLLSGWQGLLPIDHVAGLVIFDISVQGGGMTTFQVKGLLVTRMMMNDDSSPEMVIIHRSDDTHRARAAQ